MNWKDVKKDIPDYGVDVLLYGFHNYDYEKNGLEPEGRKILIGDLYSTDKNGHHFRDEEGDEFIPEYWCEITNPTKTK